MRTRLVAAGMAFACLATVTASVEPAAAGGLSFAAASTESSDWAGWDVTGGTYTSVSARWKAPAVTCSTESDSSSAFWVGLDGDTSTSVEQTGTESNCVNGVAQYKAWYEFYPAPSVNLPEVVKAGDTMTASVVYNRTSNTYVLTIKDLTRGWTYTKRGTVEAGTNASAEVIAEAPTDSQTGTVVSLADFRTMTFSDVKVNGTAIGQVATAKRITMVAAGQSFDAAAQSTVLADASTLTNGSRFSVAWKASGSSAEVPAASGTDPNGQSGGGWATPPGDTGGYGQGGGYGSGGYGGGWYGSGGYGSGGYGSGGYGSGGYGWLGF